jgi:hypothetical protein
MFDILLKNENSTRTFFDFKISVTRSKLSYKLSQSDLADVWLYVADDRVANTSQNDLQIETSPCKRLQQ